MPVDEIKDILLKYQNEETRIDQLLNKTGPNENENLHNKLKNYQRRPLSLEEAIKRNKKILKDLETVKGNLRSKAIYSPTEMQWSTVCKRYQLHPSLPVTSWKCHVPVFV